MVEDLHNLGEADELPVLFHTYEHIQVKTTTLAEASTSVCFSIHKEKSQDPQIQQEEHQSKALEEVTTFTRLGRIIYEKRGYDADVKEGNSKTSTAFLQQKII